MNVVILQPSYIPWRGYFDQIRRADLFVFYDDIQYDKHGWRNRNQIKTAQGKQWLTIPVNSKGVTGGISIKDVRIDWLKPWAKNHLKSLTISYNKSPFFKHYLPLLESFYQRRDEFLADFTIELSIALARELGISTTCFMRSSELPHIEGRKTDRVVDVLKRVGATHYICGPSASSYMEPEKFDEAGITFEYMEYNYPEYPQLYPPYDPYVSILDLMFMTGSKAIERFTWRGSTNMSVDETQKRLTQYFSEKLETFGATPKGVDYNGPESQELRFEQLVKVINPSQPFSVIDYGSGYGAMFDFLNRKGWQFEYYGIDLIEKMVLAGRETHQNFPNAHFTTNESEVPAADYVLAGAIFNIKLEESYDGWQGFTCETLKRMDRLCSKGFAFNMLTKYSDADRMAQRPDLFYGDPLFFFDFCKRNFSRNVALLHDYGLYDFTILVRKNA